MTTMAPSVSVDLEQARGIADGLQAWAERTSRAIETINAYLASASRSVRSRHERDAIVVNDRKGVLSSTIFFPRAESAEFDEARALGAVVLEMAGLVDSAKELQAELVRTSEDLRTSGRDVGPAINRALVLRNWVRRSGLEEAIQRTVARIADSPAPGPRAAAGLAFAWGAPLPTVADELLPGHDIAALHDVLELGTDHERVREELTRAVTSGYAELLDRRIDSKLRALSLDVLRQAAGDSVRLAPLQSRGYENVLHVWEGRKEIGHVPGVGPDSARAIRLAASGLREAIQSQESRRLIRIDFDPDDPVLTRLLADLLALLDLDERMGPAKDFIQRTAGELSSLPRTRSHGDALVLHRTSPRRGADVARYLGGTADDARALGLSQRHAESARRDIDVWDEFKRRSAQIYGLLGELVGVSADLDAVQGHLSSAIAEQVNAQPLNDEMLRVSLRGYQAFGAKFALVQRKTLLGDEMGLGKTIQALAVMAHLAASGSRHFLVVCPNGVLINWLREVHRHTHLTGFRIHGADRDANLRQWRARGGIAVTTYGTMPNLHIPADIDIALFVADEAHQLKNPATQRSQVASSYIDRSTRTLLLTGTPIENVVAEFRNLVSYLQPQVARELDTVEALIGAESFRERVSPVYLRRRSDDVLSELPDLVEAPDWIPFTDTEWEAYLDEVDGGHFMTMRRVAFVSDSPEQSSKTSRVIELATEAMANGKKVLVFSYFLDVLERLERQLGEHAVGTISGSRTPEARQALAERLEQSSTPKVLLAQIAAGGQGMNLQAASVVILCEPQVKPSLEDQAVKRAHRMGQVDKVVVHRVLTPDSVDERLLEILATKRSLITEYVDVSDLAEAAPEAKDISDRELARLAVSAEQERLRAELLARRESGKAKSASEPLDPSDEPTAAAPEDDRAGSDAPASDMKPTMPQLRRASGAPAVSVDEPTRTSRWEPMQWGTSICGSCDRPIDQLGHCGCS
ncbi:hypothetical protein GCM10027270_14910 [Nocardioides ginkgobilobae]